MCQPCVTGWSGSCRICRVLSSHLCCRATWSMQFKVSEKTRTQDSSRSEVTKLVVHGWVGVFLLFHRPVSVCRGARPGGLCPGATGGGEFSSLPGPVRPDHAQHGPTPGPNLFARFQEPAEPPKPGWELQSTAVQTGCRVSDKYTGGAYTQYIQHNTKQLFLFPFSD